MFWGLIAENEKRYTSRSDESFHVSMASLESSGKGDIRPKKLKYEGRVAVYAQYLGIDYLLCTLNPSDSVYQVPLDLNFSSGNSVTFHIACWSKPGSEPTKVHLTGYYLPVGTAGNISSYPLSMSTPNLVSGSSSTITIPSKSAQQSILVSGSKAKAKAESGIKKRVSIKEIIETASIEEDSDEDMTDEEESFLMNGSTTAMLGSPLDDDEDEDDDDDFDEEDLDDEEDDDFDEFDEEDSDELDDDIMGDDSPPQLSSKGNTPAAQVSTSAKKNKKNLRQTVESDDAEMITLSDEDNELKTSMNIPIKTEKKGKRKSEGKANVGNKTPEAQSPTSKKKKGGADGSSPNKTPNTPTSGLKTPEQKHKVATPSSVGHTPMKYSTKGGVMIQEVKVGNGTAVKLGKMVNVAYVGRLKNNNKEFDSGTIKFRLGKGEVIKGWDVGLEGMKVGGKRKLNVPSHMGYGKRGAAPAIPPNAALTFDIELKSVS